MENLSKIFKLKIKNVIVSVAIDGSYVADNVYNKKFYNMLNGKHYHAWHEIFFADDNPILLYYKNNEHNFSNRILSVPPFAEHCTIRKSGYRITFSYKAPGSFQKQCFLDKLFSSNQPSSVPCTPNIMRCAKEIEKIFFENNEYSDEIIEAYLKIIFCELALMNRQGKNPDKSISDDSYLDQIENILFDFQSDINLGTLAEKMKLSTKQVSRIIRKNYNSTFSEMLCERRLNVAAELLANTDMTIAEIVEYINFPSESYFYARFKKLYNLTPAEYRKKQK